MKNALKVIASFILATSVAVAVSACGGSASNPAGTTNVITTGPTTLQIIDTQAGTGATVAAGNTVVVSYTGWLYSSTATNFEGTEFDSSAADGAPLTFTVGATPRQTIAGFDQGVVGMKVGGVRTLIIPSSLAYGAAGNPPAIPANAALVFSVQLVSVQ